MKIDLEILHATDAIQIDMDTLFEAQDGSNMQILAIAKSAREVLWKEDEDAQVRVDSLLGAIIRIAAEANAKLDDAQIAFSDARLAAARAVTPCAAPVGVQ